MTEHDLSVEWNAPSQEELSPEALREQLLGLMRTYVTLPLKENQPGLQDQQASHLYLNNRLAHWALQDPQTRHLALGNTQPLPPDGEAMLAQARLKQGLEQLQTSPVAAYHSLSDAVHTGEKMLLQGRHEVLSWLIPTIFQRAELAAGQKRWAEALNEFQRGFVWIDTFAPKQPALALEKVLGLWRRALLWHEQQVPANAREDLDQALTVALTLQQTGQPVDSEWLLRMYALRAMIHRELGHIDEEIGNYQAMLEIQAQQQREQLQDETELAVAYFNLAQAYARQRIYPAALSNYGQALELTQYLKRSHRPVLISLGEVYAHRGALHQDLAQPEQALADFQKALQHLQRQLNPEGGSLRDLALHTYLRRALLYLERDQLRRAWGDYSAALALFDQAPTRKRREREQQAETQLNRANVARLLGDHTQAATDLAEAQTTLQELQAEHLLTRRELLARVSLGQARLASESSPLAAVQAYTQALQLLERLRRKHQLTDVGELATVCLERGSLFCQLGQAQNALEDLSQALAIWEFQRTQDGPFERESMIQAYTLRGFIQALEFERPEAAIANFLQVEALQPGLASYDLACLYTRQNSLDEAFAWLAVHLRQPERVPNAQLETDSDLAPLRADARWDAAICCVEAGISHAL